MKTIDAGRSAFDAQRMYPSMTTTQLRQWVESGDATPLAMEELARRDSGESQVRVTPQIMGGKVQTKIGRM